MFVLAHRFRAMKMRNSQSEDFHAWGYLQNALAEVAKLGLLNPELLAVQAILAMAIVLQGTPNPRPSSALIFTASKLAQTLKLHRQDQEPGLSFNEIEQRKRVFWIAYIIDKDISLRTGNPPAQNDGDMDIDLPAETIGLNNVHLCDNVNFLNLRIGLAIIQGRIYQNLFSTKSLRKSDIERSLAATELDAILKAWKRGIPIEFTSENGDSALRALDLPTLLHTVILNLTYFNALSTIHRFLRVSSHLHAESTGSTTISQSPDSNLLSDAICLAEARKSMIFLPLLPQGDYICVWLHLHDFCLAASTILLHVISKSAHTVGNEDLKLVEHLMKLLNTLEENEKFSEMEQTMESVKEKATTVVGIAKEPEEKSVGSTAKNGSLNGNATTTVDEFIRRMKANARCWNEENWVD
jgi:hypothetical protein